MRSQYGYDFNARQKWKFLSHCFIIDKLWPHPINYSMIISIFCLRIMWLKLEDENDSTSTFTQQTYHQVKMHKHRDEFRFTFEDKCILYACILYTYFDRYHRHLILHTKCLNHSRAHFHILCSITQT